MSTSRTGIRGASSGRRVVRAFAPAVVLALALSACGAEDEEPVASGEGDAGGSACLEGETIDFVVPYDPGGGYDAYARLLAPYLEEEMGATVVVRNQPGAGGLGAIAELANATEPDGHTIAILNGGAAVGGTLAESAAATSFDIRELTFLARVAPDPNVAVTSASGPYQTWEDVVEADEIRFGSTGVNSSDYIGANVLSAAFDLNSEVVLGFDGSAENEVAVIRGDVDIMTGGLSSRLPMINSGEMTPVLAMSEERLEELPDVPTVLEQDLSDEGLAIVEADLKRNELSRVTVAPPGMSEDLTNCLRTAFENVLTSEEVITEGAETERPVGWQSGEDAAALVEEILDAPEAYVTLLKESLQE
jgi:tripartite-type tricarboxylate transporter receptor subunit TctC